MIRTIHEDNEKPYLELSDYIYNNFDKLNDSYLFKNYILESSELIKKYKKIWPELEYKKIVSNIISLNLFIVNNII